MTDKDPAFQFDLLEELQKGDVQTKMEDKVKQVAGTDYADVIDQVMDAKTGDAKAGLRERIMTADFKSVEAMLKSEEKDLANVFLAVRQFMDTVQLGFEKLTSLNPDEQALIDKAQQFLDEVKARIPSANNQLTDAQALSDNWFLSIFNGRGGKVRRAEALIQELNRTKADREQGLADAEAKADELYRKRLQTASMEESLTHYMGLVSKIDGLVRQRVQGLVRQLTQIDDKKKSSIRLRDEAGKKFREWNEQTGDLMTKVTEESHKLAAMIAEKGTEAYAKQDQLVEDLKKQYGDTKAKLEEARAVNQEYEAAVNELSLQYDAVTRLKTNLAANLQALKAASDKRSVTWKTLVSIMQAQKDQEVTSMYRNIGGKVDEFNIEYTASAAKASEDDRLAQIAKHPERMRHLHQVGKVYAEAMAGVIRTEEELFQDYMKQYGINPEEAVASFYKHNGEEKPEGSDGAPSGGKPATEGFSVLS